MELAAVREGEDDNDVDEWGSRGGRFFFILCGLISKFLFHASTAAALLTFFCLCSVIGLIVYIVFII